MSALIFIALAAYCSFGPLPDGKAKGELSFDFDLSYPGSKGFLIDHVEVTLTHHTSGTIVTEYLQVCRWARSSWRNRESRGVLQKRRKFL